MNGTDTALKGVLSHHPEIIVWAMKQIPFEKLHIQFVSESGGLVFAFPLEEKT